MLGLAAQAPCRSSPVTSTLGRMNIQRALLLLRVLWALPCSVVGALLGLAVVGLGGSAQRVGNTTEVALAAKQQGVPAWARRLRFFAITFGHVILGQSHEVLAELRLHERVHVRQYELLGPFFFVVYPASSLFALIRGHCPYRGNSFEKQAFAQEHGHTNAT
jgi:hypothetical protein